MDVWAIIPVKSLAKSKGRLAHLLSGEERELLVSALLKHVLKIVKEAPGITQTAVISSDPRVRQIAEEHGAMWLEEKTPYDLNSAVSYAAEYAAQHGADAVLILPADLPLVTTADINLMLFAGNAGTNGTGSVIAREFQPSISPEAGPIRPVVAICSDRRGDGTNALLLCPILEFDFHYGPKSMQRHIQEALERNYQARLVNAPGLQFDLDTEQDWHVYQTDERNELVENSHF